MSFFFSLRLRFAINMFGPMTTRDNYLWRMSCAFVMSCFAGVSWGLWFEAFREDYPISGSQYCLLWMTWWLYAFVVFIVYDTLTAVASPLFMPPFVLLFIIINVSSAIFPVNIKPRFYHLDYIWPGHNCYELSIAIISHGAAGYIYRNIPIMFGWIVIFLPIQWLMNWRKNRDLLRQSSLDPKLVDRLFL